MTNDQNKTSETKVKKSKQDPLHGITLEKIITELVNDLGWEVLGSHIKINCFHENPSIKSSLTFLRRTEWARKKVERMYLWHQRQLKKKLKVDQK